MAYKADWVTLSSLVYRCVTRYLREIRIYEPNRLGRNLVS